MARILVIDDSPTVYISLKRTLGEDGHDVDQLTAFTELPSYLNAARPDLVMLDLEMPALSGIAYARYIKKCTPTPPPILVFSSRPDEELELAREQIGALGWLSKNTTGEVVRRTVRELLTSAA